MNTQDFAKIIRTTGGQQVVYMACLDDERRPAVAIVSHCNGVTSTATISFTPPGAAARRDFYFGRLDETDADIFLRDIVQRTMIGGS